jgi:hypothetical protein
MQGGLEHVINPLISEHQAIIDAVG